MHAHGVVNLTRHNILKSPLIPITDLSNDSFSTVNMGLDDGTSQHSGRYGSGSPPPYLSSHSPNPMGHSYNSYSENIVYTPMLGEYAEHIFPPYETYKLNIIGPSGNRLGSHGTRSAGGGAGNNSDMSNESSPTHNYPDFPPSPDSWIGGNGDAGNSTSAISNSTPAVNYWSEASGGCGVGGSKKRKKWRSKDWASVSTRISSL